MTLQPTVPSSYSTGHMNHNLASRGGTVLAFGVPRLGEALLLPLGDPRVMGRQFLLSGGPSLNERVSELPQSVGVLQSSVSPSRAPQSDGGGPSRMPSVTEKPSFTQFSSLGPSHRLTSIEWVVVDLPAGQAIDSHKEQTQDQGTHQGHPKGAVKRKTKSGKPDPVLRSHSILVRARVDSRKLQVMRLKYLSVQKCLSLKLPFPITRLLPRPAVPPPGNSFQKSPFHLMKFYSSFIALLHCSSSRELSLTPQERSLLDLSQV